MKIRHVAGLAVAAVLVLCGVLVLRALLLPTRQLSVAPLPARPLDETAAAARLARALTYPTVSVEDGPVDRESFLALHEHLRAAYPRAHAALRREVGSDLSLLYRWEGSHPEHEPLVLMAHQDVVPVEPGTEDAWSHPPFGGVIADGLVWGRGALDFKVGVTATLEAVETLLASGFMPARPVYLAFGHDEEVRGAGADRIARELASEGRRPYLVLDEGLPITNGMVPGVARPVALVGVAEKGYLTLELTAHGDAGHSSMPPRVTAIGKLGRALVALEEKPAAASLDGVVGEMFRFVGPEMGFGYRLLFANAWLFRPLIMRALAGNPASNATIRTTAAATMLRGGPKENVLPSSASAVVNFRIRPGEDRQQVLRLVRQIVGPDMTLRERGVSSDPSPVSPIDGEPFELLRRTIGEVFPGAVTAPALVIGATDARHYAGLTDHVYRFAPYPMTPEDRERPHGTNERLAVADYAAAVRFYARLIESGAR